MRRARKRSKTGYYHTIIRGVNKQNIFYSDADKKYFKYLMKKYSKKYKIIYHSYCILDNHVHFVIEDLKGNISFFIQVLASVYARYFNKKYDRIGHLYQDRFSSEPIEHNGYFVIAVRYVLRNAMKAGLCNSIDYKWNSYHCYKQKHSLIKKETIISIFGSLAKTIEFLNQNIDDICLDMSLRPSEKKQHNIETVCKILKTNNPIIQPNLPKEIILEKLRLLRQSGLSIRNISRITGIGKWLVQQA